MYKAAVFRVCIVRMEKVSVYVKRKSEYLMLLTKYINLLLTSLKQMVVHQCLNRSTEHQRLCDPQADARHRGHSPDLLCQR